MAQNLNFTATCLFGLERLVGEEIDALGYKRTETIDGRVHFTGDISAAARCNMWLRTAERLFINLGSFKAESFTELFDGVRNIAWENFIGKDDSFPVKGHAIKSKLFSIPDCQSIVKKAVVERLKVKYKTEWFSESKTKYQIEFFILNDMATLMIDTTGVPLFKRGYRTEAGVAPLRETLAAALVKLARPREEVILWDPFCGSGTIPVEASLIMSNTAPGINRSFAAEDFPMFGKKLFFQAKEEAVSLIKRDCAFKAYASDIDLASINTAKDNIRRSGMEKYINCFQKDAMSIKKTDERVTIVCNPPYGERMNTLAEARELYRKMGKVFSALSPWQIYIISSEEEFESLYGKRADKVRKLYNGMIKCNYYQYFKRND